MPSNRRVVPLESARSEIEQLLSYRLSVVSNLLSRSQLKRFDTVGSISQPQWRLLALVSSYGPMPVKALSRHAGLDFGQTSRLVSRMCEAGLIAKAPSEDARSVTLSLTTAGRALHRRLWAVAMECNAAFLKALTADERAALDSALGKLAGQARLALADGGHGKRRRGAAGG